MSIVRDGNIITLETEYYRRVINIKDGIATQTYHTRPGGKRLGDTWYPVFSFDESIPFEAALVIDGKNYEAGPFERHSKQDLWRREGSFSVKDVVLGRGRFGDTATFVLESRLPDMPEIELNIIYETDDEMPFLCKKVRVINRGSNPVVVDSLTVDILRFFDRKIALSAFSDYYKDIRKDDLYYFGWTRMEFPDEVGMILKPGKDFTSFDLYEAVTGVDRQDESFVLHRIYKKIAPWICSLNPSLTVNTCNTAEELYQVADEAAENGFEIVSLHVGQVFTNTGDYIPRPDLFPNGYSDIKKMVDYYHTKGLKVIPYCSATIAWRNTKVCMEHEDWQCLGPDGLRYEPSSFGNMCYHSPWGDYIREKLFYLLSDEVGFDGLGLDGPVHDLVCLEKNHKHPNEKCVNFMNWQWEKQFYSEIAAMGKIITAPETWNALLFGISTTPGGYREEDQNEFGGLPFVTMTRSCVYETRYVTPACAHATAFNLENYHGHSIEASEENTASYEHAIAGMFGYGFDGGVYAKKPYIGEKTKAIYFKWLNILKTYRDTFLGEFIHLAQPTGYSVDGVMHANSKAEVPALVVLFNPTGKEQTFFAALPLRYAELETAGSVKIEEKEVPVDSNGNAILNVAMKPYEVRAIPVYRN